MYANTHRKKPRTYSKEHSSSWKANLVKASREFSALYRTRRFITTFKSARHLSLSGDNSMQSIPHIPLTEDLF